MASHNWPTRPCYGEQRGADHQAEAAIWFQSLSGSCWLKWIAVWHNIQRHGLQPIRARLTCRTMTNAYGALIGGFWRISGRWLSRSICVTPSYRPTEIP